MKRMSFAVLAALCLVFSSWVAEASAQVRAVVSIPPQKYFVQKLGGDLVKITVMVPAGADAHTYEPRPNQMAALAKAQVYFTIGVEFEEAWLGKFRQVNPDLYVAPTQQKVPRVAMAARHYEEHEGHGHKDEGHAHEGAAGHEENGHAHEKEHGHETKGHHGEEHHHDGLDPHIWLSPKLVAIQAEAIKDGLVRIDAANQAVYERNLAAFKKELAGLDAKLAAAFKGLQGARKILVYHPAWGYFCRAYGLTQVAIEKEGKKPTSQGLAALIKQARQEKAKVIFVQPQFSDRSARTVAKAIGGQVVAIDPLAADWAANLRQVAQQVKKALY